jgi:hypothetical protein
MDGGQPPEQVVISAEAETSEDPAFKEDPDFERWAASIRSGTGEARIQGVELLDERNRPVQTVAFGSTVTVRVYLEYLEAVEDSELIIALHDRAARVRTERHEEKFYGPNLGYVLELYERYGEDPGSVDEKTRQFFEGWSPPQIETNGHSPSDTAVTGELFSTSTALEGVPLKEMKQGDQVIVDFTFEVPLRKGRYSISAGVRAGGEEDSYLDRIDVAMIFRVARRRDRKPLRGVVHLPTEIKVHTPAGER